jgi:hypothetical protein
MPPLPSAPLKHAQALIFKTALFIRLRIMKWILKMSLIMMITLLKEITTSSQPQLMFETFI